MIVFFVFFVHLCVSEYIHIQSVDVQTQILSIIRTHIVLMLRTLMRLDVSTGATPVIFFQKTESN